MQLLIKQRVFSWTDTFDIYDSDGSPLFFVRGKLLSLGHTLMVYDHEKKEIGCVRQRLLTFTPAFEFECFGQRLGAIRKEITLFRPSYRLDYRGWRVQGDVFGWNYDVEDGNGNAVMTIRKEWLSWGDTYVIDIDDDYETVPGLLIVLAIDAANCEH